MKPRIIHFDEIKLVGMRMSLSLADYPIANLWQRFMPRRGEITQVINQDLISLAIYPNNYFLEFQVARNFERWAAVEVHQFENLPEGMECITIPAGLYAVFDYRGSSQESAAFFQSIYGNWLPSSSYVLDQRPHFERLGKNYNSQDPNSEEEICIPIKKQ